MTLIKPVSPSEIPTRTEGSSTLVWGLEGSGKSHFAINTGLDVSAIYYLNFDRDVSHLLSKFQGEEVVHSKFVLTTKMQATRDCADIVSIVEAAARKGNCIVVFDNVQNWRSISNTAYLPEGEDRPIPRQYEQSNNHQRSVALILEESTQNVHTIFTVPAGPKWIGQQRKVQEAGEDMLEAKSWEGLDFAVQQSIYLFNQGHSKMTKPTPTENLSGVDWKALIITAKLNPIVQGLIISNPTLGSVLERTR